MNKMNYSKKNRQAADKYYTKSEIATVCYELLKKHLKGEYVIIEPCAGDGKLIDAVDNTEVFGFDLFPEREDIMRNDFIENPEVPYAIETTKTKVTFANPPFGSRGALCKLFIDEALKHSDTVGFIVPNSFRAYCKKYNIKDFIKIPLNGFTYAGKEYEVNCWFIIITKEPEDSKTDKFITSKLDNEVEDCKCPVLTEKDFIENMFNYYVSIAKNGI